MNATQRVGQGIRSLLGEDEFHQRHIGPSVAEQQAMLDALGRRSRSDLIERAAVLDALASGHLGGFGLDTPYDEPGAADDPMLAYPNVTITPHTAAQPRTNALRDLGEMMGGMSRLLGLAPGR